MTASEQDAYDQGFEEALETRDFTAADEWEEKRALEEYIRALEHRAERARAVAWGACGVAAGFALVALAGWLR